MSMGIAVFDAAGAPILTIGNVSYFLHETFVQAISGNSTFSKNYPELTGDTVVAFALAQQPVDATIPLVTSSPTISGTTLSLQNNSANATTYAIFVFRLGKNLPDTGYGFKVQGSDGSTLVSDSSFPYYVDGPHALTVNPSSFPTAGGGLRAFATHYVDLQSSGPPPVPLITVPERDAAYSGGCIIGFSDLGGGVFRYYIVAVGYVPTVYSLKTFQNLPVPANGIVTYNESGVVTFNSGAKYMNTWLDAMATGRCATASGSSVARSVTSVMTITTGGGLVCPGIFIGTMDCAVVGATSVFNVAAFFGVFDYFSASGIIDRTPTCVQVHESGGQYTRGSIASAGQAVTFPVTLYYNAPSYASQILRQIDSLVGYDPTPPPPVAPVEVPPGVGSTYLNMNPDITGWNLIYGGWGYYYYEKDKRYNKPFPAGNYGPQLGTITPDPSYVNGAVVGFFELINYSDYPTPGSNERGSSVQFFLVGILPWNHFTSLTIAGWGTLYTTNNVWPAMWVQDSGNNRTIWTWVPGGGSWPPLPDFTQIIIN